MAEATIIDQLKTAGPAIGILLVGLSTVAFIEAVLGGVATQVAGNETVANAFLSPANTVYNTAVPLVMLGGGLMILLPVIFYVAKKFWGK